MATRTWLPADYCYRHGRQHGPAATAYCAEVGSRDAKPETVEVWGLRRLGEIAAAAGVEFSELYDAAAALIRRAG